MQQLGRERSRRKARVGSGPMRGVKTSVRDGSIQPEGAALPDGVGECVSCVSLVFVGEALTTGV